MPQDKRQMAATDRRRPRAGGHPLLQQLDFDRRGPPSKWLLDQGPAFIRAARAAGKRTYALLENHALPAACHELFDRRLPEVLAQDWDHLAYYYYPRACEDPDQAMAVLGRHLRQVRRK